MRPLPAPLIALSGLLLGAAVIALLPASVLFTAGEQHTHAERCLERFHRDGATDLSRHQPGIVRE